MEKALTLKDVAAFLKVSESTIQRMVKMGELPKPTRIGKKIVRWFEKDIMASIQAKQDNEKPLEDIGPLTLEHVEQLVAGQF